MTRSIKKGPFVSYSVLKKVKANNLNNDSEKITFKTWSRSSTIIPSIIGNNIAVHNGKDHQEVFISENIVGNKLGEFSNTRNFITHNKSDKKGKRLFYGTKSKSTRNSIG